MLNNDQTYLRWRDIVLMEEAYRAGIAAYAEAGVKNLRKEISIAEVHDCFAITEVLTKAGIWTVDDLTREVPEKLESPNFGMSCKKRRNPPSKIVCQNQ